MIVHRHRLKLKYKALFPSSLSLATRPDRSFREQTTTQLRNYGGPGASSISTFCGALIHILPDRYRVMASLVTVRNIDIILVVSGRGHCELTSGNYIQESCTQLRGDCLGCSSYACPSGESVRKHRLDASIGGGHEDWISWCGPSINPFSEQNPDLCGQATG